MELHLDLLVSLVDRAGQTATRAAAEAFLGIVLPYVPTSGGRLGGAGLRGKLISEGVRLGKDGAGWYGRIGISGVPYAAVQYYGPLRHFFVGQDKPGALARFAQAAAVKSEREAGRAGAAVKKLRERGGKWVSTADSARTGIKEFRRTDSGRYLYGVAYRYARRAGLLSRAYFGGAAGLRWFAKAASLPTTQRRIAKIYVGTITSLLK